jgi:hypothetical protein
MDRYRRLKRLERALAAVEQRDAVRLGVAARTVRHLASEIETTRSAMTTPLFESLSLAHQTLARLAALRQRAALADDVLTAATKAAAETKSRQRHVEQRAKEMAAADERKRSMDALLETLSHPHR